jgi:hypothetical protein
VLNRAGGHCSPKRLFLDDLSEHTVGRFHLKANRLRANERAAHFGAGQSLPNGRLFFVGLIAAPSAPQRQKVHFLSD